MPRPAAATTSATLLGTDHGGSKEAHYLEWIKFEALNNARRWALETFLKEVVVPGLNELGCSPIGVFRPKHGAHGTNVFMLVPHKTIDSFLTNWDKLSETPEYQKAADTEMDTPLYERMESSLMKAFSRMPNIEVPSAIAGEKSRMFEIRI